MSNVVNLLSHSGPHLKIKMVFPGMGISIIKIRWLQDNLIFIIGIHILVRKHFYIATGPWHWRYVDMAPCNDLVWAGHKPQLKNGIWFMPLSTLLRVHFTVFSCDQAALQMVFSVCLSVCLSVRPSVRLSHLFHHVPIIVSSWNFQKLLPWSKVMSMQKVKVRGQRSRSQRSTPNLAVSGL